MLYNVIRFPICVQMHHIHEQDMRALVYSKMRGQEGNSFLQNIQLPSPIALLLKWEDVGNLLFLPTHLFSTGRKKSAISVGGPHFNCACQGHYDTIMLESRKAGLNIDPWHWYLDITITFSFFFILTIIFSFFFFLGLFINQRAKVFGPWRITLWSSFLNM